MIKRLFKFSSTSITSAALLLGVASFLSRLLGLLRVRIFANKFGAGLDLDMYYAAFRIPDLVFSIIIMGAVSSAFIPIFTQARIKKKDYWRLANNFLHSFSLLILFVAILLIIFAPHLVKMIAPGFDLEAQKLTTLLTRIMLLQPILLSISGIISGILQSFKIFFAYAISPIVYNVGIIFGAVFLTPKYGIIGLAWGVVLGSALHLLIQIPSLKSCNFQYHFVLDFKDKLMKKIVKLTIPRSISLAALQINYIAITAIASTLTIGSIAIFNYANDIQFVPLGLIGIAYAAAAFPSLASSYAKKKKEKFKKTFSTTLLEIIYLVLPITVLFFVLRNEITGVLLKTGQFGQSEVLLTSAAIGIFCIGIPFQSLIPFLSRTFFAVQNTIIPLIVNLFATGINIALAIYLVRLPNLFSFMNLSGDKRILALPLALSLAAIINVVLLLTFLSIKLKGIKFKNILSRIFKFVLINAFLFAVVNLIKNLGYRYLSQDVLSMLLIGFVSGAIGLLLYFSLSYVFKIKEVNTILRVFKRKVS
jgi:putative peptidoglycan lipid II flippase